MLKTTFWGLSVTGLLIFISMLAGVCFFCTSKRSVVPAYNDKLVALSFVMSILWIIAICGYLIDAISLLGVVLDMPVSFLGLTLLSWGNSAGDFVANPALTRLGMSQTAVTGCFAGPLFNTLIGFGVSLIVVCSSKNVEFQIADHGQLIISAVALIFTNSFSCYIILKSRGKFRSWYGYTLIGIYFLFFIIVLIYTL